MNGKETKPVKIVDLVAYDENGRGAFYSDSDITNIGVRVEDGDERVQERIYSDNILDGGDIDDLEDLVGKEVEGVYQMRGGRFPFLKLREIIL